MRSLLTDKDRSVIFAVLTVARNALATPFWYNAALAILKPLYQWRIKKRAESTEQLQQELLERFGPFQPVKNLNAIWFHVVSVGETNAAQPLIEHYLKLGHPVLVTNTTKTGQARAKSLFLKPPYTNLFQAVYLPADQKKLVRQFLQHYQPKILALVETELWPNLLDHAQQNHIPCFLLNARLSEKSAKGYAKVANLTRGMLHNLTQLLAQDQATLNRFIHLGLMQKQGQVVGSIKFDITAPADSLLKAQQLHQDWQLNTRQIIVLASTHADEEQELLALLKPYLQQNPTWLCVVVPRHPERFEDVFQITQKLQLTTQRRSLQQQIEANTQVYLADTMGELWTWYALSQVAFVGGSLNEPGGGHNILEPLVLNVATVVGQNYFNFQTIVDELKQEQAIEIAQNSQQAVALLVELLQNSSHRQNLAQQAQQVLKRNQGSLQKHIQVLDQYL